MHALAQASGQNSGSSSGMILLFLPLVLLAVMFWFSRRRQKQFQQAQQEIAVGDDVSTTSGLFGRLVALDDEVATLAVAPGVELRFDRRAVVPRRLTQSATDDGGADAPAASPQIDGTDGKA